MKELASSRAKRALWGGLLLLLMPLVFAVSLTTGSVQLDWSALFEAGSAMSPLQQDILLKVRVPRVLAAFCVGGLLAMAGLLMQALLKNPLADPYILGVSGGAGLGGVLVALCVPTALASFIMPVGAGLGALLVVVFVFWLGSTRRVYSLDRLILIGVAVSSLCSAGVSLMLTFSDSGVFRGLVFWLLGELSGTHVHLLAVAWLTCLCLCLPIARALNVIILGEDLARSVGVPVVVLRWSVYWLAALATGITVTAGGMIGFVGLVVPHALRLVLGSDHRLLVPACALGGGVFLMLADTLARSVLAPVQLPVGVVTALIGSPLFILMLVRHVELIGGRHG